MIRIYRLTRVVLNILLPVLFAGLAYRTVARDVQSQAIYLQTQAAVVAEIIEKNRQALVREIQTSRLSLSSAGAVEVDSGGAILRRDGIRIDITPVLLRTRSGVFHGRKMVDIAIGAGKTYWVAGNLIGATQPERAIYRFIPWAESLHDSLPASITGLAQWLWIDGRSVGFEQQGQTATQPELPSTVVDFVRQRETIWVGSLATAQGRVLAAVIPIKDADAWEVVGMLVLQRTLPGPAVVYWRTATRPAMLVAALTLIVGLVLVNRRLRQAFVTS